MAVFERALPARRKLDPSDPESFWALYKHIQYLQETLDYLLVNLDSSNIVEISTDETRITSGDGSTTLSGDAISLSGKNGERFLAGMEEGRFRFELAGKGGSAVLYLNGSGELVLTRNAQVSIDCGVWE